MHKLVQVLMLLGVVTTLLAILSATVRKDRHVPWLISCTLVFIITAVVLGQIDYNVKIRNCKAKQSFYLKDQDACFKLIAVK